MRGVTLIEALVCALVVAILTAIALPSYRAFVLRAQRGDARAALLRVLADEERHYLQHARYSAALAPALSEAGLYGLSVVLRDSGAGYLATAAPTAAGGQGEDRACASFSIDELGTRGATGSGAQPARDCWR
jgi:type IV pilus assembly protein PilE